MKRSVPLTVVVGGSAAVLAAAGLAAWALHVKTLGVRVDEKRQALKRLSVTQGIPPTPEVRAYLATRQAALEERYRHWVRAVTIPPAVDAAAGADPQLYFEQRVHEVQRTLERVAAARGVPVPEQLGLPKDLPPAETVPRLLAQLALIEALAPLVLDGGVRSLISFKIEDPETVAAEGGDAVFLLRLPVRMRFSGSLPEVTSVLDALARGQPVMDVRRMRVASAAQPARLEVEVVVARYLPPADRAP